MPRTPITTVYAPRVKPTTQYNRPRNWSIMPLRFDSTMWTFDSTEITFDMTEIGMPAISSSYTRPRKNKYVQDLTWANILDLSWNLVKWISGNDVNKINTVYT